MSIQGRNSTDAMLVRAGFVVVLALVNVWPVRDDEQRDVIERYQRNQQQYIRLPS
jgi:hypothetical protein